MAFILSNARGGGKDSQAARSDTDHDPETTGPASAYDHGLTSGPLPLGEDPDRLTASCVSAEKNIKALLTPVCLSGANQACSVPLIVLCNQLGAQPEVTWSISQAYSKAVSRHPL